MKLRKCKTADLMEAFGVSKQTIYNFVAEGMPKLAENSYDLVACFRWRLDRAEARAEQILAGSELKRQETRWKKAQADLQELRLAERRGQLAPVALVKQEWGKQITAARTQFLSMPSKVTPRLRGAKSPGELRAILDTEIRQILDDLASSDGVPPPPGGRPEGDRGAGRDPARAVEAAPGHKDKRVGRRKKVRPARGKPGRAGKVEDGPG